MAAGGIVSEVSRAQAPRGPLSATIAEEIVATETCCEAKPIRVPGAVQPHGFLLVTDAELNSVAVASENAEAFLHVPLRLVLGARLESLFEGELLSSLRRLRGGEAAGQQGGSTFLGTFRVSDGWFSVVSHSVGSDRVLEFERQDRLVEPGMMNGVITNFVNNLSRLQTQEQLCEALVRQVAELTGLERVLLYSFDEDGDGTVLAEVIQGDLPSCLGLKFPALDLPKPARDLYLLSTVRFIPDVNDVPSPLRGLPGEDVVGLDLAQSVLRSVSIADLEFMRAVGTMGTTASMSVSLVAGGRLWGLISAHHGQPKLVPYLVRSACDMLSKVASTQLDGFQMAARLRQTVQFHAVQRDIMAELAAEPNFVEGLIRVMPQLLQVTASAGVALVMEDRIERHGELPDEAEIKRLTDWLDEQGEMELWSSSHVAAHLPWAQAISQSASGLVAIRISSVQRRYLLWFRPEVVKTVRWAGEPETMLDANQTPSPRTSSEEWKETVRGRSLAWSEVELDSARDFRGALITVGLRRAEEAIELGEARFQQLTQALPVRVFTADDTGRLTYTNERWQATGMGRAGCWFEQTLLPPEDAALCAAQWKRAVAENRTFEAEVRLRSVDASGVTGPERWNLVRAVPFHRAGAERAGWIGCFIDLTESKEREVALRMNEKLALTGRLTSVIAHEINNPLEAITNLMYLLRAEIDTSGPATDYIGMVESELERISGITKQTLRWNRESSDARERFVAGHMVDDVLRLFAGKIRNRQIVVRVEGERSLEMRGVLGQLRQVLANLVSNAIDAAPVGGHISVCILRQGDEVGFAVHDNGAGIPKDVQGRLFEPFYSTKGDLGNGLGLYISREIMERHGGRIEVTHSSPRGTTMQVLLPLHGPPLAA